MMDAWLSSSLMTASSLPEQRLEEPPVRVEARRVQDGVVRPRNADSRRSSSLWTSWVPQMNRTLAMP